MRTAMRTVIEAFSRSGRVTCLLVLLTVSSPCSGQPANVLQNPGFEDSLVHWTTDHGTLRTDSPAPHSGAAYLFGASNGSARSYTWQSVGIDAFLMNETFVDAGKARIHYGGWQSGWQTQQDRGKIEVRFLDHEGIQLSLTDLGWFYSNSTWFERRGALSLPVGTRSIVFGFHAERVEGTNTDGYLDDAFLRLCSADLNLDGAVNSQDFFDFVTAYLATNPDADFNNDSFINSQDFFDFLNAFFAGC